MTKTEKIYRTLSIIGFALHICSFIVVMVATFLPFREKQNFYEVFTGYFSERLSGIQPYVVLLVLVAACICSFFAIKRPCFLVFVLVFSFGFYIAVFLPYTIEASFVAITSKWIGSSLSDYGVGFKLIYGLSNILYLDIAFLIYSFVVSFFMKEKV